LGERIIMAGNLRNNGCNRWVKGECFVVNEEATHSSKVQRSKEILYIHIEDKSAATMHLCI